MKPANADTEAKSLSPAVDRAARILFLLGSQPQKRMALSDIASNLRLPKSSTLNILISLESSMLVRRTDDGYQLGRALVQLGANYVSSVDVVRDFYAVCRSHAPGDLGALIQLAILDEDLNAVYLAREDCESGLRLGLTAEIGRRVPANCTAAGKALLASLPPEEFESRLTKAGKLPSLTARSLSGRDELRAAVDAARQSGRAQDDEETLANLKCLAGSIHTTQNGIAQIAISVSSAKHTLNAEKTARIDAVLTSLLDEMSLRC